MWTCNLNYWSCDCEGRRWKAVKTSPWPSWIRPRPKSIGFFLFRWFMCDPNFKSIWRKKLFSRWPPQSAILDPATPKINRVLPFQVVRVTEISNRYGEQFMSYRTHSYKCWHPASQPDGRTDGQTAGRTDSRTDDPGDNNIPLPPRGGG